MFYFIFKQFDINFFGHFTNQYNSLEYQHFDKNFNLFTKIKTLCKTATSLSKTKKESFLNSKIHPPLTKSNIQSSLTSTTSDTENRLIRDLRSFKDENK